MVQDSPLSTTTAGGVEIRQVAGVYTGGGHRPDSSRGRHFVRVGEATVVAEFAYFKAVFRAVFHECITYRSQGCAKLSKESRLDVEVLYGR